MNNLEKMLQDYEATENHATLIKFFMFGGFPDCDNCYVRDFCDKDKGRGCSATRARWLLQEHEEHDSWEKIEADAADDVVSYWGCSGVDCSECPAKIDGKRPKERFNAWGCDTAQRIDLVRRCKALAEVE
jgi:hypothetical protein